MNIRYDLNPDDVIEQTRKRVEELTNKKAHHIKEAQQLTLDYWADVDGVRFSRKPTSPQEYAEMYDNWIKLEQTYYAKVRIIELPKEGNRFVLVYGDTDDQTVTNGTGPFETIELATRWYLNSGR